MSSESLIRISELEKVSVDLVGSAKDWRDDALNTARSITAVTDSFTQECAADALRAVRSIARQMEKSRQEIGQPILKLTRGINKIAGDYCLPLEAEAKRLTVLIADYQKLEEEERRKAEMRANAEKARIMAELREKRDAITADENLTEEEAKEALEGAISESAHQMGEANAQLQVDAPKPEGVSIAQVWDYEVTSVEELYKARPDLCKVEPALGAIRAAVNGGLRESPGLRIFQKPSSRVYG